MQIKRKPEWLKIKLPAGDNYLSVKNIVADAGLHTICSSGRCPNVADCWGRGTATFMILGEICTRACKFCATKTGRPLPIDENEPMKIANSVKIMKLKHCVITSVDRDDLPDQGAGAWMQTVKKVKELNPGTTIETLIPDFSGKPELLDIVINSGQEVISHNLETVKRLTSQIRTKAKYDTSLNVISIISEAGLISKSGIMLGLGETREEILETMDDLLAVGCKVMTIGQYLQPTKSHLEVAEYVTPEVFKEYEIIGLEKGFKHIESSPLVRSSYRAEKHVE